MNDQETVLAGKGVSSSDLPSISTPTIKASNGGSFRVDEVLGGMNKWLRARGIQYAEHPTGERRWQPPLPFSPPGKVVMDATSYGDDCVQGPFLERLSSVGLHPTSEECLYLNVWAPLKPSKQKLPVMFWMHGGSFTMGGSSNYNGDGIMAYRRKTLFTLCIHPNPDLNPESKTNSNG